MRKVTFANGEFYHIYNRGVDKRNIFSGEKDFQRFLQSMKEFNTIDPIGSIYENSFNHRFDSRLDNHKLGNSVTKSKQKPKKSKLVNFVSYCLNTNHYHFILEQVVDHGIQKFMHKLGSGYTRYFNEKNKRTGVLFQGEFKAIHIENNEYLLHLSAYVNLNFKIHKLGNRVTKSSWDEYMFGNIDDSESSHFCNKDIILEQFENAKDYKNFAEESIKETIRQRSLGVSSAGLLLE